MKNNITRPRIYFSLLAAMAVATSPTLTSCSTHAGTGALIGAGTGGIVGGTRGAAIGAGVGAVGGAIMDQTVGRPKWRR